MELIFIGDGINATILTGVNIGMICATILGAKNCSIREIHDKRRNLNFANELNGQHHRDNCHRVCQLRMTRLNDLLRTIYSCRLYMME